MKKTVNFHLWEPCNMRCKFCFATFQDVKNEMLPKGHLPKEQTLDVVRQLAASGFEKITFAGGEPTLCPWLPELMALSTSLGMTTMLVTNGSRLSDEFLKQNQGNLHWIALSVDSVIDEINLKTGRAICGKKVIDFNEYKRIIDRIKQYGYRLKINTVVNRHNSNDNMISFIEYAKPERWKIFQVLPVQGQNDNHIDELTISNEQFDAYLLKHECVNEFTTMVPENNHEMTASYLMIDPAGRFYDDSKGRHTYSEPILSVGVEKAVQQITFDADRFLQRGGNYTWS